MNSIWHLKNRLPKSASLDERVRWHIAHTKNCGCREMPKTIVAELRKRGITVPKRGTK